jgi:GNAT superfamily N-acetyltransferase
MKIVEYNEVDPHQVTYLNQMALDFSLTPERVSHLRQSDPRPFPCFAIYAVENDIIMGQVGIFRLPMISVDGREDVGGIWAVSTHPEYSGRGVASTLIGEAHLRMREAGLRFSTLGTNRYRVAYRLYRQSGYVETNVSATAFGRWETAHQPTRLYAHPVNADGYDYVDHVFTDIAGDYLGFAWRHTPFEYLRRVDLSEIWILEDSHRVIGYAIAQLKNNILSIANFAVRLEADISEAVSAIAAEVKSSYVQVQVSRPSEIASLRRTGYLIAHPDWSSFMLKPLVPGISFEDALSHFGVGTDRFLFSWLDVT